MSTTLRRGSLVIGALCALFVSAPFLRADDSIGLRKAPAKATLRAIELEIEEYKGRLKTAEAGTGLKENVERFKKRLEDLEAERAAFGRLKPEEYPEPVKPETDSGSILEQSRRFGPVLPPTLREVPVMVDEACADGSLLSVQGASRSGPFYHLAGIIGEDYSILKRGKRYRLMLCLVYRREYFGLIGDYYVYVADVR